MDTGDNLLPVPLTPAISLLPVSTTLHGEMVINMNTGQSVYAPVLLTSVIPYFQCHLQ
jgi:hypothetical protein